MTPLQTLFSPRSIAVVGASRTPHKLGHDVLKNVKQFGFTGKIYPVNPNARTISGLTAYPSVAAIPGHVDVAIVMVPQPFVAQVLTECGQKGVPFAVIITAGFSETGEAGVHAEEELQKIAQRYSIRLVGPNCLGYIHTKNKLNASFAVGMPQRGNISLISQSGAMGVALLDWAYTAQVGFSKIISIGNKADISETELLRYLGDDPDTEVIMMYVESIAGGRDFINVAANISSHKPIVILKAGTSEQAKKAVASHTGSLAGSAQVVSAAFARAGIIQARTVEEFFDFGLALSHAPLPAGNRCAIITNAGGPGIMAVDAAEGTALTLPPLKQATQKKLHALLPSSASTKNPVDIIGDAPVTRYTDALHTVLPSKEIDAAIVILTPQIMTEEEATARTIIAAQKKYGKPVITSFMGGKEVNAGRAILETGGIPNYDTPERAVAALAMMCGYAAQRQRSHGVGGEKRTLQKLPDSEGHCQIRTIEAERLLQEYDLPVLRSQLFRKKEECDQLNRFPVVMKAASRDIVHKAASGVLRLGIENRTQAKKAFSAITRAVKKPAECEGVIVQPQITQKGCEVIIGMKRDASFGPVIVFGMGGSAVEIYKDVQYAIAPVRYTQARHLIQQLQAYRLMQQYDIDFFARTIVTVGRLAQEYPQITELDINPMVVYTTGGIILDVRIMTL